LADRCAKDAIFAGHVSQNPNMIEPIFPNYDRSQFI
jgi:hypothetical protein